jgi:hypothetical protein
MTTVRDGLRRVSSVTTSAAVVALIVLGPDMPLAHSSGGGLDLNGIYIAQSNGDWAKTNERYQEESTVRSKWTIASTCDTALDCKGRVSSDAGWSSDVDTTNGTWVVRRNIANWEPCADGSTAPGLQVIRFYPVGDDGGVEMTSTTYAGTDTTTSPSGSCGRNQSLVISMPFRLQKI